ncbi:HAD family hydrolase [bacterium]|nr:HAD family hydrolase [bacterium]NDC94460.1 HAD family hydrolase [bacterium]NDD84433.1 HAD family hydrolase [bacterium]NDG30197.1 HAD family hydrolase [bacterium]
MGLNVIVPLCGIGKRFSDVGYTEHKSLVRVFGKRIIDYLLDNLTSSDVRVYIACHTNIGLTVNQKNVTLINIDTHTRGAAETVALVLDFVDQSNPCLVLDGDTFYNIDIVEMTKLQTIGHLMDGAIVAFKPDPPDNSFSYIQIEWNFTGNVTDIREKEIISPYANTGGYYFANAQVLKTYIHKCIQDNFTMNGEFYLSCVIKLMLNDGLVFKPIVIEKSDFVILGTPSHVTDYVLSQQPNLVWLFDLDGTLVLTDHIYKSVWTDILKYYNISLTDDIYDNYIRGKDDYMVVETLLNSVVDVQTISDRKDTLFKSHEPIVVPGAVEFIRKLLAKSSKVCIVTNCNRTTAEWILRGIGFTQELIFNRIGLVIGNECTRPKPYPDPYLRALELTGASPERAVVFEDSCSGLLSAQSAGIGLIVGIGQNRDVLMSRGAHVTLKDFQTVSDISNYSGIMRNLCEGLSKAYTCATGKKVCKDDVHINPTKLKGGYIADVMTVHIGDCDYVVKMENTRESNLRTVAIELDLYNREYLFYDTIAPLLNATDVRVPKCYGIVRDDNFTPIGLLLENLNTPDYTIGIDLNTQSVEVSLKIVKRMAQLHATFWNRTSSFKSIKRNDDPQFSNWSQFVKYKYTDFRTRWQNVLTPSQLEIGENIVARFKDIQRELSTGDLTLLHGDIKSGNIFFRTSDMEPHFIDWQYLTCGKGVQDLVFLLIESYTPHVAKKYTELFKRYYFCILTELGCEYSWSQFEIDFKTAMCYYPFFVAVWFGTTPEEDLIDVNFPFFYIKRLFAFLEAN